MHFGMFLIYNRLKGKHDCLFAVPNLFLWNITVECLFNLLEKIIKNPPKLNII